MIFDMAFTGEPNLLVLGGAKTCVFNLETQEIDKVLEGH